MKILRRGIIFTRSKLLHAPLRHIMRTVRVDDLEAIQCEIEVAIHENENPWRSSSRGASSSLDIDSLTLTCSARRKSHFNK